MTDEVEMDVPVSAAEAFALFQHYPQRLLWDPFLCEAYLLDGPEPAVGVTARCVAKPRWLGLKMDTIYVSYRAPWQAAVKMVSGPWVLAQFAASLRHQSLSETTSRVVYRYNFKVRPHWLAPLLERVLTLWFRVETRRRLQAFRNHLSPAGLFRARVASRCHSRKAAK
jgi:hypothetical protein